jgi:GNAT superfamily N-acetyltransferase
LKLMMADGAANGSTIDMGGVTCVVRDLTTDYDEPLLYRFYHEVLVPNFPIQDELFPYEDMLPCMRDTEEQSDPSGYSMIVRILVQESPEAAIVGGHFSEYYPDSKCGLLCYLAVSDAYRGHGVGRFVAEDSVTSMHRRAVMHGQQRCNLVLAETNAHWVDDGVMDPTLRHALLAHLGFKHIAFPYIQPPLSPDKTQFSEVRDLLLLQYAGPWCGGAYAAAVAVPCDSILEHIHAFARSVHLEPADYQQEPWFLEMQARAGSLADLKVLPWISETCSDAGTIFSAGQAGASTTAEA